MLPCLLNLQAIKGPDDDPCCRSEWLLAPHDILPEGSVAAGDIAFDTPFEPSSGADAVVELEGDKVQLQQATIVIPAGHDLTGLIFVCKSQDDTMWWRDGEIQSSRGLLMAVPAMSLTACSVTCILSGCRWQQLHVSYSRLHER